MRKLRFVLLVRVLLFVPNNDDLKKINNVIENILVNDEAVSPLSRPVFFFCCPLTSDPATYFLELSVLKDLLEFTIRFSLLSSRLIKKLVGAFMVC